MRVFHTMTLRSKLLRNMSPTQALHKMKRSKEWSLFFDVLIKQSVIKQESYAKDPLRFHQPPYESSKTFSPWNFYVFIVFIIHYIDRDTCKETRMSALKDRRRKLPTLSWTLYDIFLFHSRHLGWSTFNIVGRRTSRKDNSIQIWLWHFSTRELQHKRNRLMLFEKGNAQTSRIPGDVFPTQPFQFHASIFSPDYKRKVRKSVGTFPTFPIQ